jgi:hypothetical protein
MLAGTLPSFEARSDPGLSHFGQVFGEAGIEFSPIGRTLTANMFGTSPLVPSGDSLMLEPTDPDTLEGRMCRLVGGSQIGAGWE